MDDSVVQLFGTPLPKPWSYGVTRDGRIFFIDDERRITTWIHPVLGFAIQSGYNSTSDLPPGFEEGITAEGVPYYIDHFQESTSFHPPQTGEHPPPQPIIISVDSESKSSTDSRKPQPQKKKSSKQKILDKTPSAKRSPNSPVAKRGWLYHQEGGGLKSWKRRWCVLSDFCLFVYKNSEEDKLVESILLPSYKISQCGIDDNIKREYAFKAEHENVRTFYLAADSLENMSSWMNVLSLASVLQRDPSIEEQIRRHKSLTGAEDEDEGGFSSPQANQPSQEYPDTLPSDASRYPDPYAHDVGNYHDRVPQPENLFESYVSPEQGPLNSSRDYNTQDPSYPSREGQTFNPLREMNFQDSMRDRNYNGEQWEEPHYQNVPLKNHNNLSAFQNEDYKGQGHSARPDLMNSHQSLISNQSYSQRDFDNDAKDYGKLRRGDANWDISDYENSYGKQSSREKPDLWTPPRDQGGLRGYRESYHDSFTSLENKENVHNSAARNEKYDSMQRLHEWKQRMQRSSVTSNNSNTSPRNHNQDTSPRQQALTVDTSSSPANQPLHYNQQQGSQHAVSHLGSGDHLLRTADQYGSHNRLSPHDRRYGSQDRFPSPRDDQYGSQERFTSHHGQYGSQQLDGYTSGSHNRLADASFSSDGLSPAPERPPLPAAYREQIAMEMAATKTPRSKEDLLLGVAGSRVRQNDPVVFQFPESPPLRSPNQKNSPISEQIREPVNSYHGQQGEPVYPHTYQRAKQQAELQREASNLQQPAYPQSYLRAKYDEQTHKPTNHSPQNGFPESYWNAYKRENPEGSQPYPQQHVDGILSRDPSIRGSDRQLNGSLPRDHSLHPSDRNLFSQTPERQPYQQLKGTSSKISPSHNPYQTSSVPTNQWTNPLSHDRGIYTLKEDPDMADTDILATKTFLNLQKTLNGHLRLSISAGDLIGKSHEELVLLLIQLRRQQAMLETAQTQCKQRLDELRDSEKTYRRVRHNSVGALPEAMESEHNHYTELVNENNELLKKLEVFKPLVNLVDNLVTMGSLYGGDNLMLASQFKQHKLRPGQYTPPKKLVEFSRHLQEQKLAETHKHELQQLTEEEMDFEEKLQKLIELDRTLQDHSVAVASLQDDRAMLEKSLSGLSKKLDQAHYDGDTRLYDRLLQQQRNMEKEMSKVRQQLAEQSRILEEIATENARVEHEVMLLRKRVSGHLNRSISSPTLSSESAHAKSRLERELSSIQSIMDGLNQQGAKLSQVMSTLRRSNPDLTDTPEKESATIKATTYTETDMDTMESVDLASHQLMPPGGTSKSSPQQRGMVRSSPHAHLPTSGQQLYQTAGSRHQVSPYAHSRQQSYGPGSEDPSLVQNTLSSRDVYRPAGEGHETSTDSLSRLQSYQSYGFDTSAFSQQPVTQSLNSMQESHQRSPRSDPRHSDAAGAHVRTPSFQSPQEHDGNNDMGRHSRQQSFQSTGMSYPDADTSQDTYPQTSQDGWPSTDFSMASESDAYSPLDISEADDNTKRFYGLIPKEKPKYQTVRDIKKRETERRSRERDRRRPPGDGEGNDSYLSDVSSSASRGPLIPAIRRSQSLPRNMSKTDEPAKKSVPQISAQPLVRGAYIRHSDRTSDRKPKPQSSTNLRASTSRLPRKKRLSEISSKSAVERLYPQRSATSPSDVSVRSDSESVTSSLHSVPFRKSRDTTDGHVSDSAAGLVSVKDRFRDLLDTESLPMMTSSPQSTLDRSKTKESPGNLSSSSVTQKFSPQSSFSGSHSKLHHGAPVGTVRPVLSSKDSFLVRAQPAIVTSNVSYNVADYDKIMKGEPFSPVTSSKNDLDLSFKPVFSHDQSLLSDDINKDHSFTVESQKVPYKANLSLLPTSTSPSNQTSFSPSYVSTNQKLPSENMPSVQQSHVQESKPSTRVSPSVSPRRQAFMETRKQARARFLTVSSSQPVTLEQHADHKNKVHSAAGDLIVPRSQEAALSIMDTELSKFDEQTIDREVLYLPDKVEIPERYTPDSDDDPDLSQEERLERQKKTERIKKMLATHSLQEFTSEELHIRQGQGRLHQALEKEKKQREHVLDIRQALALEAKSKTRELAAQRRKTWSNETPGRHVEGAEDDGYNTMRSTADSNSFYT